MATETEGPSVPLPASPAGGGSGGVKAGVLTEWRVGAGTVVTDLARRAVDSALTYTDALGQTALALVVESGNADAVHALLSRDPLPPMAGAILAAATFNRPHLIPLLARSGADVREMDATGATALHRAADNGNVEVMRMLLEMGCHVDARDLLQRTPLHCAVASGSAECTLLLFQAGADVSATDDLGRSVAEIAESMRSRVAVDEKTLAAFAALFSEEVDKGGEGEEGGDGGGEDVEGPGSGEGEEGEGGMTMLQATAAATGDGDQPITGITDLAVLIQLVLAKLRVSVQQDLASSYEHIFTVLDSTNTGVCTSDDIASGILEMGIVVPDDLLPGLMEHMAGRPGATSLTQEEFVQFCTITASPPTPTAVVGGSADGSPHGVDGVVAEGTASMLAGDDGGDVVSTAGIDTSMGAGVAHVGGEGDDGAPGPPPPDDETVVTLIQALWARFQAGVEEGQPPTSYDDWYDLFAPDGGAGFDAAGLHAAAAVLGIPGTLSDFVQVVQVVWGHNHAGQPPQSIMVQRDEFVQFCREPLA